MKKRTIANLTSLKPEVIAGLKVLLKGGNASELPLADQFEVERTLPHGHVAAVCGLFGQLGMFALLERKASQERSLAAALIVLRLVDPGSKLAAARQLNRESATHTLAEELGLDEKIDEKDLYRAMSWLGKRQNRIERRLADRYLRDGHPVLYDLSLTYYEGSTCVLAQRGYSRDGKKGTRQINFGLLCSQKGCPVAVEVFPGNTADPSTVQAQVDKLRERFGMEKILLVGDGGMLTGARIEALRQCEDISWISALRTERARKRGELLEKTEDALTAISAACSRKRNPYRGKDRIARRVEREAGKYKMLKHFKLTFRETSLDFERDEDFIGQETALDGLYVVRARREGTGHLNSDELVSTYKSLSNVESAFRSVKTETLQVRPVFHRREDMVRAHIFVRMLAYHLQWHMSRKLKPILFEDEVPGGAPRSSPVAKAHRFDSAEQKAVSKRTEEGLCVHSFHSLLAELSTLCRVTLRPKIDEVQSFCKLSKQTPIQEKVFQLLGLQPKIMPCSQ